ncbi:MAG: fibronectin type III domain-containing protein, partial [Flavobacterium sp.]|uniref:fibronectin type III domain-containing protein n=1 Tax=Flavobacterium sp. TaxID=239 RepID=UPI00262ACED6
MKFIFTLIVLSILGCCNAQTNFTPSNWSSLVGYWNFENSANLNQAQIGNDLINHGAFAQVAGPTATDFAIRKTLGNYFECTHSILTDGQPTVNQYSLMIDFKIPSTGQWYSFFQTVPTNITDGDLFVNLAGKVGVYSLGYSTLSIVPNEWYRLVITVDAGNSIKVYLDGTQWNAGASDTLNGRFSLQSILLLLADDNGEDNQMDVASMGIFDKTLSAAEVFTIGSLHSNTPALPDFLPFLQTATPTSIYVSWHSSDIAQNPEIKFGTSTANLDQTQTGTWEQISGAYYWHTVKLTGLLPDTEYFYQCYNGTFASQIYSFRTPALKTTPNQHIRMVVLGDNRTDIAKTTQNVQQIKSKLVELYGTDIHNSVDLILNCGDIVTNGTIISQYS